MRVRQGTNRKGAGELRLARGACLSTLLVGLPAVAIAGFMHSTPGALGAAAGMALALVAFTGAGLLAAWARRFGDMTWAGVIATGVGGRLVGYLVVLQALAGVPGLHRTSLALATFATTVVTLAYELRMLSTDPRYFWVNTARGVAR